MFFSFCNADKLLHNPAVQGCGAWNLAPDHLVPQLRVLPFGSSPHRVLKAPDRLVAPVAGGTDLGVMVLKSPPRWCHSPVDLRLRSSTCFTIGVKDFGVRSHWDGSTFEYTFARVFTRKVLPVPKIFLGKTNIDFPLPCTLHRWLFSDLPDGKLSRFL